MSSFLATQLTPENYWRGIVRLGQNVASYKLALAKTLLTLAADGRPFASFQDFAVRYTHQRTEHLKAADKQCTATSGRFLKICREFSDGKASKTALVDGAFSLGFANVIDAFHVVNRCEVVTRFFIDDRKTAARISSSSALRRRRLAHCEGIGATPV